MEDLLDKIAQRYAKKAVKKEMQKISKIMYKAICNSFKEGWLECEKVDITSGSFCEKECTLYNTEYRCRECTKSEFD